MGSRSVLIVDESAETRAVLRAALERTGTSAVEASRADEALQLTSATPPDLIVLDLDCDPSPDCQAAQRLYALASRSRTPILLIGTAQREVGRPTSNKWSRRPSSDHDLLEQP